MLDPPNLADEKIAAALHAQYGISTASLTFLPLGNDSATWVYRLEANGGQSYFLKLRASEGFSPSSLAVPHYLKNQGLPHILAPLATSDQALWASVEDFALSLYPFIDGRLGADAGLSIQHWLSFGALMKQVHACKLPPELLPLVPRERFVPSRRRVITDMKATIARQTFSDPFESELAAFWSARQDEIELLVDRADTLGRQLRATLAPRVLCHADMHTWNVLIDQDQQLWLIDWDEVVLALKERDLMFVVGGIGGDGVGPQESAHFLQGYGDGTVNPQALAYYRYAWAVQDMAANGEQVFFSPHLGRETRRAAVQGFISLFAPGNIVELALASPAKPQ